MPRPCSPTNVDPRPAPALRRRRITILIGASVLIALGATSGPAHAAWVVPFLKPAPIVRPAPPDVSWMDDVPEKAGPHAKGKIAVFAFKGDDVNEPVRAAVVKLLRSKGLNVTASLRPVDSAAQFREMSYTLNLGAFVEGEITGDGPHQTAVIHLRSGLSGKRIASTKLTGATPQMVGTVGHKVWPALGGAMMRSCSSAAHPRQRERAPLRIEAGEPLDDSVTADRS
jgi:hypothetical protein